jgi:hypothetical protein
VKYSKYTALLASCTCWLFAVFAFAATDGLYNLIETASSWDGANGGRLQQPTADYDFIYGDDAYLSYTLPWPVIFYGFTYTTITVDTNGNIWFAYLGSADSIALPAAGKGPVVAAWNDDLSSAQSGGVFIRHKTNPERVVVEWQTETFTEEGENLPNDFEVVLFQNGRIRGDYKAFAALDAVDNGSGISKDDLQHFLDLSATTAPVTTLAGRSFLFSDVSLPSQLALNLFFSGTGSGAVASSPAGIACNAACQGLFPPVGQISLTPAPAQYSLFAGWSGGPCSGIGSCLITLDADSSTTALFDRDVARQVNIGGTQPLYYATLQGAYDAAADNSVMKLWATTYSEDIDCNRPVAVTLRGGYDENYTAIVGEPLLSGTMTVTDGTVTVDGLSIR